MVGIEHASGTEFADIILGNDGDNWLWGENGDDTINAFAGNDLVEVAPAMRSPTAAPATTLSRSGRTTPRSPESPVSLLLQGAAQATGIGGDDPVRLREPVRIDGERPARPATAATIVLAGDIGNDALTGGGGNDTLYGDGRLIVDTHGTGYSGPIADYPDVAAMDPSLIGGNDLLEGGAGDDSLWGGAGSDTASYAGSSAAVFVSLGSGFASGAATGEDDLHDIENVAGSAFNDQLLGSAADNAPRRRGRPRLHSRGRRQ